MLDKIKGGIVVSCQALEDEPLHGSKIMGRVALAAQLGGANGIRANSKEDIIEIRKNVNLPIVGIVKRDYPDSEIYITPTMKEIDELLSTGCEMIALDATDRKRPNHESLKTFIENIKAKNSNVLLMADISTVSEAIEAEKLGFDCVSTTLMGYTDASKEYNVSTNDFYYLTEILKNVNIPVIAEGHISTPNMAKKALEKGAYSVVVGSAITRPKLITETFVSAIRY
ncbi:N-acetylmannosamine-6-phosphate 2-epimerase [Bacillus sp. FJAT-50079]|uniref:N-acetylmannosamine-6-phosphate 2-epimerase n=1 Tax=Bacillus sp. FJAT-50079 TaxID=2833577 RepID=UPI001BC8DE7C|nr:N-acetylmannosamine-6-phosphate 2-epimerase [Bacillus sp. FJAT-50079]MBS4206683.1 N-acetylmannosamine-6-phosphate 2-epimerase [Bacillus sp. FJAT-50079]